MRGEFTAQKGELITSITYLYGAVIVGGSQKGELIKSIIYLYSITYGAFLQLGPFCSWGLSAVGAFLQATSRVPRWWIGERPPDMAASCDIYK